MGLSAVQSRNSDLHAVGAHFLSQQQCGSTDFLFVWTGRLCDDTRPQIHACGLLTTQSFHLVRDRQRPKREENREFASYEAFYIVSDTHSTRHPQHRHTHTHTHTLAMAHIVFACGDPILFVYEFSTTIRGLTSDGELGHVVNVACRCVHMFHVCRCRFRCASPCICKPVAVGVRSLAALFH